MTNLSSPANAAEEGFRRTAEWEASTHQMGDGAQGNQKYVNGETGAETVFSADGTLVTDPMNIGTRNFGKNPASHTALDVAPWLLWGNSKEDRSNVVVRTAIAGVGVMEAATAGAVKLVKSLVGK